MPDPTPDNTYDEDDEPELYAAWAEGAKAAHTDEDLSPVEDLYDDRDVAYAFLKGYTEASRA
ncbi:MAG: hypothetical protein BRD55_01305 [Bacteroidetes bacterium SW_9_63_38]|nr:MAG: hypothetical protein BRD55_01305 [Bacteroidetes bacterium SW_9_63_38]